MFFSDIFLITTTITIDAKNDFFFQEKYETECVTAKSEVQNLSGKVRNLESVLDEMHKAAENRREIERQHKEALVRI
jgi:hypothetical protein